jgi:predicted short-subunit dehydrogenase-like oxidoreductase (DUF2520 family)
MKPSFAIVGCGRLGNALGRFLSEKGYRAVGAASRTLASARELADLMGAGKVGTSPREVTGKADVVFITTPDGVIETVCRSISEARGFAENAVVLHCSGALPSTILQGARSCGAAVGSLHPLQSFASKTFRRSPFPGIIMDMEGDGPAVRMAERIAADLGAKSLLIKTEKKPLFHAAAVAASNYLVSLLDLAFQLMGEAGVTPQAAWQVLRPLVNGTLSNIDETGIPEALTGPIARGDLETVRGHLQSITMNLPHLVPAYKVLGLHTIQVALAKGTLDGAAAAGLQDLLKAGP